jgi:hypothetical protein
MSHQDRRDPLPVDYQYPTHGVDCDCPPCRDIIARVMPSRNQILTDDWFALEIRERQRTQTAYGWGV